MYTLVIKDKNDTKINEITNWDSFGYDFELNRPGSAAINLNIDMLGKFTPANLYPLKSYLDIYRYGTKVWSGIMTPLNGKVSTDTGNLTLNFEGYLYLTEKMFAGMEEKTFTAIDQGTILWTLIDDFQSLPNGDFGITEGVVTTGITRDRIYPVAKNVYEAIQQMSEVENGVDVEITPVKVFNVYAHKGIRLNHVFEYGKNISDFNFSFNSKDFANQFIVLGLRQGSAALYSVSSNMQSQEEYGLFQGVKTHPDVELVETLNEHGRNYVDVYSKMIEVYSASVFGDDPSFLGYSVGDEIRLKINKGYLDIDTYKRIKKIAVSVTTEEKENVSLDFM